MIFVPFGVIALLSMEPCIPPFLLSMSLHCEEIERKEGVLHIFLVLFEAWMTLQMLCFGSTWVFYIIFAGTVSILDYFQLLRR